MPGERKATHELSEFDVQEVSLVDRAANKMRFAVTKRSGGMPGMKKMAKADWVARAKTLKSALDAAMLKLRKADGVTKLDLSLPADAKEGLMTALAESLDKLSAIATMVGDAKVDDAAQPPADLGGALAQVCEMLEGAAVQFAGYTEEGAGAPGEKPAEGAGAQPPPPPEGAGPPPEQKRYVGKAELDNLTAATVTIQAAQTQLWSASDMMGKDPAGASKKLAQISSMLESAAGFMGAATGAMSPAPEGEAAKSAASKGLPPELGDGDSLKTELHDGDSLRTELHDGDSLKSELHKCVAVAHATAAKLTKAGRKIAGARYEKLKTLHDTLGGLLNDLAYDEASGATDKGAGAKKPEEDAAGMKKRLDDALADAVETKKRLAEVEKRTSGPNSVPAGEGGKAPVKKNYSEDLGVGVEERRQNRVAANKRK
jgi:hypothetical protein